MGKLLQFGKNFFYNSNGKCITFINYHQRIQSRNEKTDMAAKKWAEKYVKQREAFFWGGVVNRYNYPSNK